MLHGIKAHDAEILTLCYSPPTSQHSIENDTDHVDQEFVFLASGGRDRLIHIYDASTSLPDEKRYHLVTTLDSHSSSVTVSHFTADGKKFISCSGDKTMVINSIDGNEFRRIKSIPTPHGTINGFALDSATTKFAVSTGQDKRINVWNLQTGKLMRSYRPEGLNSEFYKCCVDPSGNTYDYCYCYYSLNHSFFDLILLFINQYCLNYFLILDDNTIGMFVATCSFDKQIRIYDFFSGELIHQVN